MALTESIVQAIEANAAIHGYARILAVRIAVGPLAGVECEALRFCFEAVSHGTITEGARLDIQETTATAYCLHCENTVTIRQYFDACPGCGSHRLQVQSGDELQIKELEVV